MTRHRQILLAGLVSVAILAINGSGWAETSQKASARPGPLSGFFTRRVPSPEPLNLLPPPFGQAGAAAPQPSRPDAQVRREKTRDASGLKEKPIRRRAVSARLPRPRPAEAGTASVESMPVTATIEDAAQAEQQYPGGVLPPAGLKDSQPSQPEAVVRPATVASVPFPEILVPGFDGFIGVEVLGAEPRVTGSVRSNEAPSASTVAVPDSQNGVTAATADPSQALSSPEARKAEPLPEPDLLGQPYELVRSLQELQDQIAAGSTAAFEAQRKLLARIDERFAGTGPDTWKDPRNASALVTYVLSGGPPTTLKRLIEGGGLPAGGEKLMRGALAYVEGRVPEAREHLGDIDPRDLPGSMGAQVALAQAAIAVASEPKLAMFKLDLARLLAPGTLVEEAALRRQILVASDLDDVAKFHLLARQYLSRFRRSVYAGNFRQRFAAALSRMEFTNDQEQFPRLDELLADLDPEVRLEIYLTVARASAVRGNFTAARLSAHRAMTLAKTNSPEAARAILYRGSASIVTGDGLMPTLDDLQSMDTTLLNDADRRLYNMVSMVATSIQTAADRPSQAAEQSLGRGSADDNREALAEGQTSPVVDRARAALASVDTLLEGLPQ